MSKRGASLAKRLGEARRLHAQGHLGMALRAYGELHQDAPDYPELLHVYGVALLQSGRAQEGETHLSRAVDLAPDNADILYDFAVMRDSQGNLGEALATLLRVVEVDPQRLDAWAAIGMYERDRGNRAGGAEAYRTAYRLDPKRTDLALQAAELMPPEEGAELLIESLQNQPGEKALLLPLAECLMRANRMEEAEATLQTLRMHRSEASVLSRHLGSIYLRQKRFGEAAAALYEAVQADVGDVEAWILLSNVRDAVGDVDGAIAAIDRALSIRPDDLMLIAIRARLHQGVARTEEGLQSLASLPPTIRATANIRLIEGMLMPPIMESTEQIAQLRERWMETMADVEARPTFVPEPWSSIGLTGYFLGYQGLNDRPLMEAFARATLASSPNLRYTAQDLGGSGGEKIKVGFLSANMRNHSVGRVLIDLMANLDRERFEIVLFQLPDVKGFGQEKGAEAADRVVPLVTQLDASRAAVEAERLDVLIFCDQHMNTFGDALSYSRLAPIQATTWGHPGTSGRDTIDYWISCEDWEPEGNERFYTEKLVRLKHAPYVSQESPFSDVPARREEFGLRDDVHLYGCLQMPFKLHPDFDEYLAAVLAADPKGRIVFTSGEHFRHKDRLKARFAKSFDLSRVDFLPKLSFTKYLDVLGLCDAHLDPIHFGGANTSFDTLSRGRPIVTLPGEQMRGRATYGAYRQMGYEEMIVGSLPEYVELAVRLAYDHRFNRDVQRKIRDTKHLLFNNLAPVSELETWLESVVRR